MKQIGEDIETYVDLVNVYDKYAEDVKPTVYFLGLIGEVSELCGAINNVEVFSQDESKEKQWQDKTIDELGDVLWYWFGLAKDLKYDYVEMWNRVKLDVEHTNPNGNELLKIVESAGRIVEHLKKSIRDDSGEITTKRAIRIQEKMIETLDHILLLCKDLKMDPYEILQRNYDKLYNRNEAGTIQGEGDGITKDERK